MVVGRWARTPFGPFTDVMVERPGGHRILLAPDDRIAEFVASTYHFDEVRTVDVAVAGDRERWQVDAGPLSVVLERGPRTALGLLLSAVPRPLATAPSWIRLIDVVAARVLPGVRTRGSAGGGREELYAALDLHRIRRAEVRWDGVDQGALAPVEPPVRFGFGSTPPTPCLVRVVSLVSD